MKDIQNIKDKRGIKIEEVGITDLTVPVRFNFFDRRLSVISKLKISTELLDKKGAHMSRFVEIAEGLRNSLLNERLLITTVKKIKSKMESEFAGLELKFTLFLNKKSPVSKKIGGMNYSCLIGCKISNSKIIFVTEVKVPIATLCPCSKEISRFGAHNQRALVNLSVESRELITPVELIKAIEQRGSSELFSILKKVDEKYVTEKMYNYPMFVEDIVREVALWSKSKTKILGYKIKCISYESIHNHNIYAIINKKNVDY